MERKIYTENPYCIDCGKKKTIFNTGTRVSKNNPKWELYLSVCKECARRRTSAWKHSHPNLQLVKEINQHLNDMPVSRKLLAIRGLLDRIK